MQLGQRETEMSILRAEAGKLRALVAESSEEVARMEGVNKLLKDQLEKAVSEDKLKATEERWEGVLPCCWQPLCCGRCA